MAALLLWRGLAVRAAVGWSGCEMLPTSGRPPMSSTRLLAVSLTPLESRRDVVLHVAERAEQLGYDAFFLAEGWGYDAGVLLAEVATRTHTIQLGTGILNIWGRSAAGVAMLASSLASVSGGRFVLGLGAGSPALAEGLHDVEFVAPVYRLAAVAREVRRLLDGERVTPSVPGRSRPLKLGVRPESEIPVYLAALGPRAVRLCGQVADGWVPFLLPRSGLQDGVRLLRDGAADTGRPLPRVCPALPLAVSSDPVEARKIASWWVIFYLLSMGPLYRDTMTRHGLGDAVAALLETNPDPRTSDVPGSAQVLIDELTLCGEADHARAALESWYEAGAQVPALTLPPGRELAELDYMLEVMRPTPS
jgi:alkanesulfonate monooxygenase SsuD/methylene tetrahydromethanopterin reductase-like flavin-dependent oxidoreductase (luciferase family)